MILASFAISEALIGMPLSNTSNTLDSYSLNPSDLSLSIIISLFNIAVAINYCKYTWILPACQYHYVTYLVISKIMLKKAINTKKNG